MAVCWTLPVKLGHSVRFYPDTRCFVLKTLRLNGVPPDCNAFRSTKENRPPGAFGGRKLHQIVADCINTCKADCLRILHTICSSYRAGGIMRPLLIGRVANYMGKQGNFRFTKIPLIDINAVCKAQPHVTYSF